jgi:hypothetical protein
VHILISGHAQEYRLAVIRISKSGKATHPVTNLPDFSTQLGTLEIATGPDKASAAESRHL